MFFFFGLKLASSNPVYYQDFMNNMWSQHSKKIAEFEEKRYIINVQQVSDRLDRIKDVEITTVFMTPSEHKFFNKFLNKLNDTTIDPAKDVVYNINIVERHKRAKAAVYAYESHAEDHDLGFFWIPFVVCISTGVTLIGAYLLWACDRYENDPANSLIFATEGQKLVSGN